MAELGKILQGYGVDLDYWKRREIRGFFDTLRRPSADWHPIVAEELGLPVPDLREAFRDFRRDVLKRLLDVEPVDWSDESSGERMWQAAETLSTTFEPPHFRTVITVRHLEDLQKADVRAIAESLGVSIMHSSFSPTPGFLDIFQYLWTKAPSSFLTLDRLLVEVYESAMPVRKEHGYVRRNSLPGLTYELCQQLASFCLPELSSLGKTLGTELNQSNWLTWCALIWLPFSSLFTELALLETAYDLSPDSRRSELGVVLGLRYWELWKPMLLKHLELEEDEGLSRLWKEHAMYEVGEDFYVALNMSDYLVMRGQLVESAEALLCSGIIVFGEQAELGQANVASLVTAVDEAHNWATGRDETEKTEGRIRACEAAVAVAPNPVAQMEVGLMLLGFAGVDKPPRYAAGESFDDLKEYLLDISVEDVASAIKLPYRDLTLGEGLLTSGWLYPLSGEDTECRKQVLRLAVRAFGCAICSRISPFGALLCLDGLRSAFYELRDSGGLQDVCRRGLVILEAAEFEWRELHRVFLDGLDDVRALERIAANRSIEEQENRLRARLGACWDGLTEDVRTRLCEAEAIYAVTPTIRGMSYNYAVNSFACVLEAQLRDNLGRVIQEYFRSRDPGPRSRGERAEEAATAWTLGEFAYKLKNPLIVAIINDRTGDFSDFFKTELPRHVQEVSELRNPSSHGKVGQKRATKADALKIRNILLSPEEEGGPAVIAKLARFAMAMRKASGNETPDSK